jgi:hypothetical protein
VAWTDNTALLDDTWEYGAQFQPFGMGCAGSAGVPCVGRRATRQRSHDLQRHHQEPAAEQPVRLPGRWPEPHDLGARQPADAAPRASAARCRTYTSVDQIFTIPASGGTATWTCNVPNLPSLVGQALYLQGSRWRPGCERGRPHDVERATLVIGY